MDTECFGLIFHSRLGVQISRLGSMIGSFETDSFTVRNNSLKIKGLPSIKVASIPEGDKKLIRILKTALRVTVRFVVKQVKQITPEDAPVSWY